MKFYIASDHAGFELKNKILENFKDIIDIGPFEFVKEDDYPDFVYKLVTQMKKDLENSKGILVCMNGGGVSIASNKFKGIRSAIAMSEEHVQTLISDDNINIVCLGSNFLSTEDAIKIVKSYLELNFEPEERHLRRLSKLSIIENSNL